MKKLKQRNKKFNKSLLKKPLALLLSLIVCFFTFAGFLTEAATLRSTPTAKLTVSLAWKSDVPLLNGVAKATGKNRTVVISATGDANTSTTVTVSTFDISAKADEGEYASVKQTYTLSGGQSAELILAPTDTHKVHSSGGDVDDKATWLDDELYTRQFGVKIVSVGEDTTIGNNFLRAYTHARNGFFYTTYNSSSWMNYNAYDRDLGSVPGGVTYNGAYELFTSWIGNESYKLQAEQSKSLSITPNICGVDANAWAVLNYFDTAKLYFTGSVRINDYKPVIHTGGFQITVKDNSGNIAFRNGHSGSMNWDQHILEWFDDSKGLYNDGKSGYASFTTFAVGRGKSLTTNYQYKKFLEYSKGPYTWTVKNYATYYEKEIWGTQLSFTIADNTAPQIVSYSIDNDNVYGFNKDGYTDRVYLTVKFSKPVQVEEYDLATATPFGLYASVLDGGLDTGRDLQFDYIDGSLTDTLIFEAKLDPTAILGRSDICGDQIRIEGFHSGAVHVADMLYNTNNRNNGYDFANFNANGVSTTLQCQIDTRQPELSKTSATSGVQKDHTVNFNLAGMGTGGQVTYRWSSLATIDEVEAADKESTSSSGDIWKTHSYNSGTNTIVGSTFNGNMYLHIKAVSIAGMRDELTIGPLTFDNTAPTISTLNNTEYAQYTKSHTLQIRVTDNYSVEKIYLYVKDSDGTVKIDKRQVFGTGSDGSMTKKSGTNTYTMNLTHTEVGLPTDSYGAYTVGFAAEDDLGNFRSVVWDSQKVMFDNRNTFAITMQANYSSTVLADNNIYGSSAAIPLQVVVIGTEAAGAEDVYSVYSVRKDGVDIYRNGALTSGTWAEHGLENIPTVTNYDNRMRAWIDFNTNARAEYEFVFSQNGEKQSQVLKFYVYQVDDTQSPYNVGLLNSNERLLVNRVWQFTTPYYYTLQSVGVQTQNYDRTATGVANKPIFSSPQKAYEYAYYQECLDVSILYLGTDSTSLAYIDALQSGASDTHAKAPGETTQAKTDQTWICYKTIDWSPDSSYAGTRSSWVYYYYGEGRIEDVSRSEFSPLLERAIRDNAANIAGVTVDGQGNITSLNRDWLRLTKDTGLVDEYNQPFYAKEAIFYAPQTAVAASTAYSHDIQYGGDTQIYSNTIEYKGEDNVSRTLPLATNYTFQLTGAYHRAYFRSESGDSWTEIQNGQTLKDLFTTSGMYYIAELGGGYKQIAIYFDVDAPLVSAEMERVNVAQTSFIFSADLNGSDISAKSIVLKDILDLAHKESGRPVEYDQYSYIYFRSNDITETGIMDFITLEELNSVSAAPESKAFQYEFSDSKINCTMYVYDRLGNYIQVTLRANTAPLIAQKPVETPNESVSFFVNRSKDELKHFAIYRTGEVAPLDDLTTYSPTKTYYQSGTYTMEVSDIYGNSVTESITFNREPPTVYFAYKNAIGTYTSVPVQSTSTGGASSAAVVTFTAPNTYRVSTATDVRIAYSTGSAYTWTMTTPGVDVIQGFNESEQFLNIPATDQEWTLKIAYTNDPKVYIVVTCSKDVEAPRISASVQVPNYTFNEEYGYGNVLFGVNEQAGMNTSVAQNGSTMNGDSVTFSYSDISDIIEVSYTLNNGASQIQDVSGKSGSFTVNEKGTYVVTTKDILGNTSTFTFTLSQDLNFSADTGGSPIECPTEPLQYITGTGAQATFSKTTYSGKEITITLREYLNLALAWTNGIDTAVFDIAFREGQLRVGLYDPSQPEGVQAQLFTLTDGATGVLISNLGTPVNYSYTKGEKDGDPGTLVLSMPKPTVAYERWQIRVATAQNVNPVIMQIERSGVAPSLRLIRTDTQAVLPTVAGGYVGINKPITLTGNLTKISSILAYYSAEYTMDFSGIDVSNIYDLFVSNSVRTLQEAGYYKIHVKDIYGNQQDIYVRISYGLDVDVTVQYQAVDSRSTTLLGGGTYTFYTNNCVLVNIWDVDATLEFTKDGLPATMIRTDQNGYIQVMIRNSGNYLLTIEDDCNNRYELTVQITDPISVPYDNYLIGFNEEAIRRADNYTNGTLSLNVESMVRNGIAYAAFRASEQEPWTVIYDVMGIAGSGYVEARPNCIGEQNGTYEVIFTDEYGNKCSVTVHVSSAEQLTVYRNVQTSVDPQILNLSQLPSSGAWSNFKIVLKNTAQQYRLLINGAPASFDANGEYRMQLPSGMGEGSADYTVEYVDEYGNRYAFAVHLFRKVPVVKSNVEGELISLDGKTFVRGNISYTWENETVVATFVKDSGTAMAYQQGEWITDDGLYMFTFTDIAGNIANVVITRDTKISYQMLWDNRLVYNGISVTGGISINSLDETIKAVEILKDGKPISMALLNFTEHGSYVVTLSDEVGNTEQVRFDLFNHAVQSFTYTAGSGYAISQLWYQIEGQKLSYVGGVGMDEGGNPIYTFDSDGQYEVELLHLETNQSFTFTVVVDNIAPKAILEGVENGGITRANVLLSGLEENDTVEIWKNGELISTQLIGVSRNSPEISEAGVYRIVIRDLAGNEVVYEFEREFTTNAASNAMICITMVGASMGGVVLMRGRGKLRTK